MQSQPDPARRAEVMRQGLAEVAKMKGDIYRKALLNALQGEPQDAPTIENEKDYVIIGGVKVGKKGR